MKKMLPWLLLAAFLALVLPWAHRRDRLLSTFHPGETKVVGLGQGTFPTLHFMDGTEEKYYSAFWTEDDYGALSHTVEAPSFIAVEVLKTHVHANNWATTGGEYFIRADEVRISVRDNGIPGTYEIKVTYSHPRFTTLKETPSISWVILVRAPE